MGGLDGQAKETSNSIQYMVVDSSMKMRDAKANKDNHQYFVYFKFATQLIMPHMSFNARKKLQDDFNALKALETEVRANEMHQSSKDTTIQEMRYMFADNREYFLLDALPKIGLGKDLEEGQIDFNKTDIDTLVRAVRDVGTGLNASLEKITEQKSPGA
jgi:hypothetical protein